jgi:hypothetical protein
LGNPRSDLVNGYFQEIASILACVTKEPLRRTTIPYETGQYHELLFAHNPASLNVPELRFGFWHSFSVFWDEDAYRWRTSIEEYKYQITNANAHELFAFHWHPKSKVLLPHVHLGFGMRGHGLPIDNKAHIPTGRVPIVDIISFLLSELHVKPLLADWEQRIVVARQRIADFEG